MGSLVPSCLWRLSTRVVVALDGRFGDPLDAYVNGSQTWLRDDGPGRVTIEWRLHPVAGFQRPAAVRSRHDLFPEVALALGTGAEPVADPRALWDGLEAFPAYGDEVEPAPLAAAAAEALGVAPDLVGLVDHQEVADRWEHAGGSISIVEALTQQLTAQPDSHGEM